MSIEPVLLAGAALTLAGVLASKLATRLGIPALLLFLGLGMLVGTDGPGGVEFDDAGAAQAVGIAALALILFDGGLSTRWSTVRPVLARGTVLATVGVLITAGIAGTTASLLLGLPIEVGLLLGAIISSTDAAAVFSVLRSRSTDLRGGIQPTLELESGANDPMAVFLTVTLVGVASGSGTSWVALVPMLVAQAGIGAVAGVAAGHVGRLLLNRVNLGSDGLYPVVTITLALITYSGATLAGGSGFLAVYLCGMWLGNHDLVHRNGIARFHDAVAWLAQIGMFLVLGLLVWPSRLPAVAGAALGVTAVLVFVARPVATAICLTPFGVPARHQAVIAWVGLRGATPIVLATFPLVEGLTDSQTLFDVVFFVVLTSVLVQGTTVGPVARLFGVSSPAPARQPAPLEPGRPLPDGTTLRELTVVPSSFGDGRPVVELHLPERVLLVLVDRRGTYLVPTGSTRLEAGDTVTLLADDAAMATAGELLCEVEGPPPGDAPGRDGSPGDDRTGEGPGSRTT
ncbi:MAG: potassium/proton antiporter [Microthrixaceae bacterium]|nr:potassium/proton antiporter [Microthrixaceae bacterium]